MEQGGPPPAYNQAHQYGPPPMQQQPMHYVPSQSRDLNKLADQDPPSYEQDEFRAQRMQMSHVATEHGAEEATAPPQPLPLHAPRQQQQQHLQEIPLQPQQITAQPQPQQITVQPQPQQMVPHNYAPTQHTVIYQQAPAPAAALQPVIFNNNNNNNNAASSSASGGGHVIVHHRPGVNHCLHCVISLFFCPWVFVWMILCCRDGCDGCCCCCGGRRTTVITT